MDLPQCALLIVLTLSSCILLGQNQEYQPVLLNYQQIYYMGEYIVIGVKYAGTCTSLGAEAFTRADIMAQRFDSPMTFDAIDNKIAISRRSLSQNENQAMCVRLVARNGSTTCSSANFPYTFYHFSPDANHTLINGRGKVRIQIPDLPHCESSPIFVWPKNTSGEKENCYCRPLEDENYSFKGCVQNCNTKYNVTLQNGSVVFQNLNNDQFFAHFICNEDPCPPDVSCFMLSFMDTYEIKSSATKQDMGLVLLSLGFLSWTIFGQD